MCGIAGYLGQTVSRHRVKKVFRMLQTRGGHACGMASSLNGTEWELKSACTASELVKHRDFKQLTTNADWVLFHARYGTGGSEHDNKNNHPFWDSKHKIMLIHNGVIHNADELKTKFNYYYEPEVVETDSAIILHLISKFLTKYNSIEKAIRRTVKYLQGDYAVVLTYKGKFYMFSNGRPLLLYKIRGTYYFCSTEDIFEKGFGTKAKDFLVREFKDNDFLVVEQKKHTVLAPIEPKKKRVKKVFHYYNTNTYSVPAWQTTQYNEIGSFCADCGATKRIEYDEQAGDFLCPECRQFYKGRGWWRNV